MITLIMLLVAILLALTPALADSGLGHTPTPEPVYLVLEPGQELWVLCASGLHLQAFGKQSGHGACDAAPTR